MPKTFNYHDRATISWLERGDRDGYPILVQHGLIANVLDHHLFQTLTDAGWRVICLARPGYGGSSAYELANILEWGAIVAALADELGLTRFDVLGMSSGAPYSYAIAAKRPDRVRKVFIFSGIPALYDDEVVAQWPHPIDRNATIPALQALVRELFFTGLAESALNQNDYRDSMRNGGFGLALDLKLRCLDWGFRLEDIKPRVHMQHSRHDNFACAKITAGKLPDCILRVREDSEHFSPQLLDGFLRETVLPSRE